MKLQKLLQNNYIHLIGNIPYYSILYFLITFLLRSKYNVKSWVYVLPNIAHIQCWWLQQHRIQLLQTSSILAHSTFCGCLWRWMCSLHLTSFWAKWWTHVAQCHHGFGEPVCYSLKWPRKWKSTSKHQFLWNSFKHLGAHHAHTLLHLNREWTMLGTVFTNHSHEMDRIQMVSCWFSKTSSTIALCSHVPNLPGWKVQSSWWMPTNFWTLSTLSLHDAVSAHHHQNPALTGS
jgi:hypothetical protein